MVRHIIRERDEELFIELNPDGERENAPDIAASSEDYARRFFGATGSWFTRVQGDATLRMLKPWPAATVLDVGGGHGQLAPLLVENNFKVTVHGSDPVCINRVSRLVADGRCSFVTGDLFKLPFPDQSVDIVIAFRLLAHLPDWPRFVGELTRVARHAVVLDFPPSRSLNFFLPLFFKLKLKLEGNTRVFSVLKESSLVSEFERRRFVAAERYAQYFMPMFVHRTLKMHTLSFVLEQPFRWTGLTAFLGSPLIMKFVRSGDASHRV